jgi:hypothetical protein
MLVRKLKIVTLLLFLVQSTPGQQELHSALLPEHEAKAVADRYSREWSAAFDGSWKPSKPDLDGLESKLSQISQLPILGWGSRIHIDHPDRYFRQYIAVTVAGKQRIFVNAFCDEKPPADWHEHMFVVIDGANCYWQALYDPATRQFSNLRINARA